MATGARRRTVMMLMLVTPLAPTAACAAKHAPPPLGDATSAERIDPCGLLTVAEIATATGWTVGRPEPDEHQRRGQAACDWEDVPNGAMVQVQVAEGGGRKLFDQRRTELDAIGQATDVDVTGADAAWGDATQGVVGILVGDDFAQVAAYGPPKSQTQHLELGALVAGRLR